MPKRYFRVVNTTLETYNEVWVFDGLPDGFQPSTDNIISYKGVCVSSPRKGRVGHQGSFGFSIPKNVKEVFLLNV